MTSLSELWTESLRPVSSLDLALHQNKVMTIKDWLMKKCLIVDHANDGGAACDILVLGGVSGGGKSTTVEVLCDELGITVQTLSLENLMISTFSKSSRVDTFDTDKLSASYKPLIAGNSRSTRQPKLLLLHDSPFELASFLQSHSENIIEKHLSTQLFYDKFLLPQRIPLVIILSGVIGEDDLNFVSQSALPSTIKSICNYKIMFCQPISSTQMKKLLNDAIRRLILPSPIRARVMKSKVGSYKQLVEELCVTCGGDIRHALLQLQFSVSREAEIKKNIQKKTSKDSNSDDIEDFEDDDISQLEKSQSNSYLCRDESFSSLHSIAKLVHAKLDCFGKLEFECDQVLDRGQLPLDMSVLFIHGNAPAQICNSASIACFLSDEVNFQSWEDIALNQLQTISSLFSDIDILHSCKFVPGQLDRSGLSSFPDEFVHAMSSRSVAYSRGIGWKEIIAEGKARGAKDKFQAIYRPTFLDHRKSSSARQKDVNLQRDDFWRLHPMSQRLDCSTLTLEVYPLSRILSHDNQRLFHIMNKQDNMNDTNLFKNSINSRKRGIQEHLKEQQFLSKLDEEFEDIEEYDD